MAAVTEVPKADPVAVRALANFAIFRLSIAGRLDLVDAWDSVLVGRKLKVEDSEALQESLEIVISDLVKGISNAKEYAQRKAMGIALLASEEEWGLNRLEVARITRQT